jgi:hypothetical protein
MHGTAGCASGGAVVQLVLLQLDEVQLQQLDVLQLEQLDVLVLLLQMFMTSADRSAMSSTSNVSVWRFRNSLRMASGSATDVGCCGAMGLSLSRGRCQSWAGSVPHHHRGSGGGTRGCSPVGDRPAADGAATETRRGLDTSAWGRPRHRQPQLEVLVLVLQQLEVLQEQQLEQEQDELVAASTSSAPPSISSISKVSVSSSRSSLFSVIGMCSPPSGMRAS